MRRAIVLRVLAGLLPLVTGISGVLNGPMELALSLTPLQRLTTYGVLAYGISGLVLGMLVLSGLRPRIGASRRRRRAALALGNTWGLAVVLTGTIAPVAFGGTSWLVGLAAFAATALVVALALWLVRVVERADAPAGATPGAPDDRVTTRRAPDDG